MNDANQVARQKTAVDVLNAIILLLKLESERYAFYQHQAWEREEILTDKGTRLMEECFDGVKVGEYQMSIATFDGGHQTIVIKASVNSKHHTVIIPLIGRHGSRFGTCTCGKPATDGVPCAHMVVVAKSSSIEGLTRTQIMPYWWTTAHWCDQYPLELYCHGDITMENVKSKHRPDELFAYCPTWATGQKKGERDCGSHQRLWKEEAKESSPDVLQDLPQVQSQH